MVVDLDGLVSATWVKRRGEGQSQWSRCSQTMAHRYDSLESLGQQFGVLSQVYCKLLLQQFLLFLQLDVLQQLLREKTAPSLNHVSHYG